MAFSAEEEAYIRSQPLARVSTVSPDGQPDVVPVGFRFDGFRFFIGGADPARARRTRNVLAGNPKVALLIDDLATVRPWAPRYLRVYGTARVVEEAGSGGVMPVLEITPVVSWSYNLAGAALVGDLTRLSPHRTVHGPADDEA